MVKSQRSPKKDLCSEDYKPKSFSPGVSSGLNSQYYNTKSSTNLKKQKGAWIRNPTPLLLAQRLGPTKSQKNRNEMINALIKGISVELLITIVIKNVIMLINLLKL